ncbi:MAG: VIT family protein [Planctomycetes bacterium]|nr:VIT family protein [Planctomycetota bacterium]
MIHGERHKSASIGWLRAAVLGANDGLISTSSLVVGVAAAQAEPSSIVVTAAAGVVAGALSMAAGEYVSVSSQADIEAADRKRERGELTADPEYERDELAGIWVRRGLSPELATRVADELTAHDALEAHLRDELGYTEHSRARPMQAALASALAFTLGAMPPVLFATSVPATQLERLLPPTTVALLAVLGALAARLGGAAPLRAALRVGAWGAAAMLGSMLIGRWVGVQV